MSKPQEGGCFHTLDVLLQYGYFISAVTLLFLVYDGPHNKSYQQDPRRSNAKGGRHDPMLNTDLTVSWQEQSGGSPTTIQYSLLSIANGKSIRGVTAAANDAPETLTIAHAQVSRGKTTTGVPLVSDRHLVRNDLVAPNGGNPVSVSVQLVIEAPRQGVTKAEIETQVKKLIATLYTSDADFYQGLHKILANEP